MPGAFPSGRLAWHNTAYSRQIISQNHRCATPAIDPTKNRHVYVNREDRFHAPMSPACRKSLLKVRGDSGNEVDCHLVELTACRHRPVKGHANRADWVRMPSAESRG